MLVLVLPRYSVLLTAGIDSSFSVSVSPSSVESCRRSHYAAVCSACDVNLQVSSSLSGRIVWLLCFICRLSSPLSLSLPPLSGRVGLWFGDQSPASWFHVVPHIRSQCLICHVHVLLQGKTKRSAESAKFTIA